VNTYFDVKVKFVDIGSQRALSISGSVTGDAFPDTELVIRDRARNALLIATVDRVGSPFYSLFGAHENNPLIDINVTVPIDPAGNFNGPAAISNFSYLGPYGLGSWWIGVVQPVYSGGR
jgi:hypothetical protein